MVLVGYTLKNIRAGLLGAILLGKQLLIAIIAHLLLVNHLIKVRIYAINQMPSTWGNFGELLAVVAVGFILEVVDNIGYVLIREVA